MNKIIIHYSYSLHPYHLLENYSHHWSFPFKDINNIFFFLHLCYYFWKLSFFFLFYLCCWMYIHCCEVFIFYPDVIYTCNYPVAGFLPEVQSPSFGRMDLQVHREQSPLRHCPVDWSWRGPASPSDCVFVKKYTTIVHTKQ